MWTSLSPPWRRERAPVLAHIRRAPAAGSRTSRASRVPTASSGPSRRTSTSSAWPRPTTAISTPPKRPSRPGKHVLIEKPSVLPLQELDELERARAGKERPGQGRLPQALRPGSQEAPHARRRRRAARTSTTAIARCSSRRASATGQFAEWIAGRNPGTYVAVHYIKLIDFTFGGTAARRVVVHRTTRHRRAGRRQHLGLDPAAADLRISPTAAKPRSTSTRVGSRPDNFPGYVEQEVQFRFDNGVWNGHSRKRGVEFTVEGKTPTVLKTTMNTHYNGTFVEPWGEPDATRLRHRGAPPVRRRGGVRRVRRSGGAAERSRRGDARASLQRSRRGSPGRGRRPGDGGDPGPRRQGTPDGVARISADGRLTLHLPGQPEPIVLYSN